MWAVFKVEKDARLPLIVDEYDDGFQAVIGKWQPKMRFCVDDFSGALVTILG